MSSCSLGVPNEVFLIILDASFMTRSVITVTGCIFVHWRSRQQKLNLIMRLKSINAQTGFNCVSRHRSLTFQGGNVMSFTIITLKNILVVFGSLAIFFCRRCNNRGYDRVLFIDICLESPTYSANYDCCAY